MKKKVLTSVIALSSTLYANAQTTNVPIVGNLVTIISTLGLGLGVLGVAIGGFAMGLNLLNYDPENNQSGQIITKVKAKALSTLSGSIVLCSISAICKWWEELSSLFN